MEIKLEDVAKRFNYQIIFKGINYSFSDREKYAILGINGSGKSTLLKILSGFLTPTQGKVSFNINGKNIKVEEIYKVVNYVAPYIALPQKLTLEEIFDFHAAFKSLNDGLSKQDFIGILNLKNIKNKYISEFSSGMKQRLKLALAFLFKSDYLLLDEPLVNLDSQGFDWYKMLINSYLCDRLLIIASNDKAEYFCCNKHINIADFK